MNERDIVGLAEGDGRGTRRRGEGAISGNLGVRELLIQQKGSHPMTRLNPSGTQYRLARALLDYLSGIDPSAVGLVQTLLSLIPSHRLPRGRESSPRSR